MMTQDESTPLRGVNCFWCRHPFEEEPIGCPIRYTPATFKKECKTDISQEEYTIQQEIPQYLQTNNTDSKDYYTVVGCFCTFNCCLAYINDHRHDPVYTQSKELLMGIFYKMYNTSELRPAHPWTLLKAYGGTMSIDEFRYTSNNVYTKTLYDIECVPRKRRRGEVYREEYII